ncbi:DNA polymerase III subunit chi [Acetobacteraceae bacterium]|nr:DNA polymerase III subunit chi [Acetobacteraceae bacterium]
MILQIATQDKNLSQKPEIAFYHLTRLRVEEVLPRLLSKTLDLGKRALIRASSDILASELDQKLWLYETPTSWLPHATSKSLGKNGRAEDQPIWISGPEMPVENPNKAQFLFQIDGGCLEENLQPYQRIFNLFDGNNETLLNAARKRWKSLRDQNCFILTYWRQNASGEWSKEHTHHPQESV